MGKQCKVVFEVLQKGEVCKKKKKTGEICLSGLYQLCLSYVTVKMDIKH